ncbi:MAG: NTP transferase domain-containing protein [Bacteroidota bacterium]
MTTAGQNNAALLYGLVLAGGKSQRMGHDKGLIQWHGKEQQYYIADLLKNVCDDVYISCRAEQVQDITASYKALPDTIDCKGPLAGILSAFERSPEAAWLVVACDLPLMDESTLRYLITNRDSSKIATTFKSPFDGLPEPLITIWEPASIPILKAAVVDGFSCPRKILIRNEQRVNILTPPNGDALLNANTPEDAEQVRRLLNTHQNT